jgi:hypothetical protein
MTNTKDPVVTVLDTTVGDTGNTQTMKLGFMAEDTPARITIEAGSGDTVVIEGKSHADDSFQTVHSFIHGTDVAPIDLYLPLIWRARRTVDGGGADSTVRIVNTFGQLFDSHTA